MGRLQRKKQSSQKKKKKSDANGQTGEAAAQIAVASPKADAVKPAKKPKVPTGKKAVPAAAKPRDNVFTRSIQFLREVKVELKKVTWPSRKQTVGSTVVVIILVTIISFFLGAVDIGLSSLVKLVLH